MAFPSLPFPFHSKFLQALILIIFYINLLFLQHTDTRATSALTNDTDYMALLKFKKSISSDPTKILSSWNISNHFCTWTGITCSHMHQRVTELKLPGYGLRGTISPHVGNLSFLRNLFLDNNSFYGEIPPQLGRLFRLQQLFLKENKLTGEIPINLTSCYELKHLNLYFNSFSGKIPFQIGSLKKLEKLNLSSNHLSGEIPASIWNLSSLDVIAVADNNLEGSLQKEIGQLKNLRALAIGENKLSGILPSSLYNMSSLTLLSATQNQLRGTLPVNMFSNLHDLQEFEIGVNQFSGSIPSSVTNASSRHIFDISNNSFAGKVPSFGNLKDLHWLNLELNNLGNGSDNDLDFVTSLANCSKLELLSLYYDNFGGNLPTSIGNLSTQLIHLYLGGSEIYGTIPSILGKYTNLIDLNLEDSLFSGTIPASFGNLNQLQGLTLQGNQLSGKIPTSFGKLSQLVTLELYDNMLEGKIPPIFGNMTNLKSLDLSANNLTGAIPKVVFYLSSLSVLLNLSHNSLNGSIPMEVGTLKNLGSLDLSENHLSGKIPWTIGECENMEYLNLQGNSFTGIMPPSLASLKGLKHLDLSQNNLSGSILSSLQNISVLEYLNVSFNMLDGELPVKGVFSNVSAISVIGNNELCGGITELHLSPCPIKVDTKRKHHNLKIMTIIICVTFSALLIFVLAFNWRRRKNKDSSSTSPTIEQLSKVSYQNLRSATEGFSANNLIGSGSFGSVYKGRLEAEDKLVAIKVINLQKKGADKSFISECNALKNIRHRNLVKILTCCSSIDFKGQEFRALVFEFMSNGSLEKWLHSDLTNVDQSSTLNLHQRFNVICDVAFALHYLHYECEQPVVHCDLKPSNVLLDDDMVAHVSDFGLARLLSTLGISSKQTSTTGIKGTVGYAPPEYGISSMVSTQGDVYSFGILVLEMLTGRSPTEEMFEDGHNLYSYVKAAYPNNLLEIVDLALLPQQIQQTGTALEEENSMEEPMRLHPDDERSILSLFEIGLACSAESPKERLNMMDVTRELNKIRNTYRFG